MLCVDIPAGVAGAKTVRVGARADAADFVGCRGRGRQGEGGLVVNEKRKGSSDGYCLPLSCFPFLLAFFDGGVSRTHPGALNQRAENLTIACASSARVS
jgi:hypothetical protein